MTAVEDQSTTAITSVRVEPIQASPSITTAITASPTISIEKEQLNPNNKLIQVHSIFDTISGEVGLIPQGSLATFIRLAGCNLRCPWCDAKNALRVSDGEPYTPEDVLNKIRKGTKNIIITGGEPLLQQKQLQPLIYELNERGIMIQIETHGGILPSLIGVDCYIVDYKLPGSKENDKMMPLESYLKYPSKTFIKFVCDGVQDFIFAHSIVVQIQRINNTAPDPKIIVWNRPINIQFAFSPVYGKLDPLELYGWMQNAIDDIGHDAILNVQLHKVTHVGDDEEGRSRLKK